jgi:hypothetical protein
MLPRMPPKIDLDDADRDELIAMLREAIDREPYRIGPRIKRLRAILAKFDPPATRPEPYPAPKPAGEPSLVLAKRKSPRRRR